MINPIIQKQIEESRDFRRSLARKNFYWFFPIYFQHYLTHETAPYQQELFRLLQNKNIPLLAVTAFRGSAKSTIASFAYPIWSIIGEPQKKYILIISQTQEQAKQILTNIKVELEENELLKNDFGPFTEVADEWRSNSLVIPQYGTRISATSRSEGMRGLRHRQHRPDLIIIDDVEDLESVKTREGRDNVWNWLTGEVIPLGSSGTNIVLIGNLLHEDSLMMRVKEYINKGKMTGVYREYPLIDKNQNILWKGLYPDRQSIEAKRKSIADESAWHREYLLTIIADKDRVIQRPWIRYYDELPDRKKYPPFLIGVGVDLAISQSETANFTAFIPAYVIRCETKIHIYILPQITNKRLTFPQTIQSLKDTSDILRSLYSIEPRFYIESVGYQAAVAQQLLQERILAEEVKISHQDKRTRLAVTSPYLETGRVFFPKYNAEVLIDQLVNFGIEKYDDMSDAFALLMTKIIQIDQPYERIKPESDKPYRRIFRDGEYIDPTKPLNAGIWDMEW